MAAHKSVIPWDLVVTKKDGQIFIDKRPDSQLGTCRLRPEQRGSARLTRRRPQTL